jgi:Predicted permease, DMT superfamily
MNDIASAGANGASGSRAKAYAFIALTTLLFSSMEIALKTVSGRFNPLQLNFLRFTIGGLFLLPFALRSLKKRGSRITAADLGFFALSGLACVVASMTLYQLAIQYCKASIVAILFSCNPVFVLPLAALFLKERIRGYNVATLVASLAGMLCIVNPFGGSAEVSTLGLVLSVGSAIVFAIYGVMGKTRSGRIGGLATTAFSFLFGSAELLILILLSRLPAVAQGLVGLGLGSFARIPFFSGLSADVLPIFAYICLCVTGVGFASYFMAIEESSASTAAIVFYIKPALAPVLAFIILGESIAPNTLGGIGLIVAGSAITIFGQRRLR